MSELSYKEAGVDIEAGDHFVDEIKAICHSTYREEVLSPLGGFGALFRLPTERYREPVLVSSTDGVGTKLKLAFAADRHETVGIDLVAMCVNDILVLGAEPLFFLDYMATGRLKGEQAVAVLRGIAEGCRQAKCALIGGETAEMPGFYAPGEYDLAGFSVGVVERGEVIDGRTIGPGDRLIGLPSSGVHSNGFSLVRLVLERHALALGSPFDTARSLADVLLEPTRI
ncbi:MAG: phosphoribosylformylglycinamidine cyclo-ligase, partial [Myxococcales bacterium]|nr:phosphoribosylformylglycinamidine cyclo-ligase [Myxococcales bacterium]